MATVTKGKTFITGETVEPADMHQLVDSATVTNIVDADISASAAIAGSKLADGGVTTAKIADANVTQAKLASTVVPLGVGQTWQTVTSSRTLGTDYTNSTGRPIFVSVRVAMDTPVLANLLIDSEVFAWEQADGASGSRHTLHGIVLPGQTYRVSAQFGSITQYIWKELR